MEPDLAMRWQVALDMAGSYVASERYDDAEAVMHAHLEPASEAPTEARSTYRKIADNLSEQEREAVMFPEPRKYTLAEAAETLAQRLEDSDESYRYLAARWLRTDTRTHEEGS